MRFRFMLLCSSLAAAALVSDTSLGYGSRFITGLTAFVPGKVFKAPVIFRAPDGNAYAVAPDGQFVRRWESPEPPRELDYTRPLVTGTLLSSLTFVPGAFSKVVEFDQYGSEVWSYAHPDQTVAFHHDHSRLASGNILILCWRPLTVPAISPIELRDDCLMEVDRGGNVVWEWQSSDHFDDLPLSDEDKARIFAAGGDWTHGNSAMEIPTNDHTDPRFAEGNIVVSFRHLNMIAIIDKSTGHIVWTADNITIGQHHAHMIPGYLPGGGNILVFDNGLAGVSHNPGAAAGRTHSRVIEIDPTDNSVVYEYTASDSGQPRFWFHGGFISGAQRLPNGNTFITEGPTGRLFEVAPDGEIVWEFVNPIFADLRGAPSNQIYRAEKAWQWVQLGHWP